VGVSFFCGAQVGSILTHIFAVQTEGFRGFIQDTEANSRIFPQSRLQIFLSTSFPINTFLIILPLDTV
jgi:hypothetical protein